MMTSPWIPIDVGEAKLFRLSNKVQCLAAINFLKNILRIIWISKRKRLKKRFVTVRVVGTVSE